MPARSWRALVVRDARLLARRRVILASLILYPLLLSIVLYGAFQEPPTRLSLAVVNGDEDGATLRVGERALSSATLVNATRAVADVTLAADRDEAMHLLREGKVDAALFVPPGFVRDLGRQTGNATLSLAVDRADPVRAAIAEAAVRGMVSRFSREVVEAKLQSALASVRLVTEGGTLDFGVVQLKLLGLSASLDAVEAARVNATGQDAARLDEVITYLQFTRRGLSDADSLLRGTALPVGVQDVEGPARTSLRESALPGVLALSIFWTGALAAAALWSAEVEAGVASRLRALPVPRYRHALSKGLVAVGVALAQAAVVLVIAVAFFEARVAAPALSAGAVLMAAVAAAAVGALAAGLARATGGASLLVVLALLPMTLLAGLFLPVAYMPAPAQAASQILPLTHAVEALRDGIVRASPLSEAWMPLSALATAALALGAGAAALDPLRQQR